MDISNTLKDAIKDNLGPLGFGALKGFRYGDIIEDSKKLGEIGFVDEEKVMMIKALGQIHKFKRFKDFYDYYGWWAARSWDAIQFIPKKDIYFAGFSAYKTKKQEPFEFEWQYKIGDGPESASVTETRDANTMEDFWFDIFIPDVVFVPAETPIEVSIKMNLDSDYYRGENGYDFANIDDNTHKDMFTIKDSSKC